MSLSHAIVNCRKTFKTPFTHWTINNVLNEATINEIYSVKIPKGKVIFDGTRAGDKSGDDLLSKLRVFISANNCQDFPELTKLIKEMQSKTCMNLIANLINEDLTDAFVRLEVIADQNGFWLEPHLDIKEKLMSGLIFVNKFNENENLGTDFYNENLELIKTIPYKNNYGYLFKSEEKSWHGLEKKAIKHERRCLQLNYVTFKTDWPVDK